MTGDTFGHCVGEDLEIVRGILCQILGDHIPDAEFIFGDSIRAISQSSDRVQVEFTKNSPREFALAIGADGLHSNVRAIGFGDESRFVRDLGLYLSVYTVPNYLKLDRMEMQHHIPSWEEWPRSGALAAMRMPKRVLVLSRRPSLICETELNSNKCSQVFIRESVWEVPRLLGMMPSAPDYYFDAAAQIRMDHWSQGRVDLVG